jgi:hypothetical protein
MAKKVLSFLARAAKDFFRRFLAFRKYFGSVLDLNIGSIFGTNY